MTNKKLYRGLSTFAMSVLIVCSVSSIVYAKDGDIYNTDNTNLGGIGNILLHNKSAIFNLIKNIETYEYEVANKLYAASQVNEQFIKNPDATVVAVHAAVKANLIPIVAAPGTVASVSAISVNSFKIVFNQSPADTSKINFSVLKGTTPITVTTTWNTATTEATVTSSSDLQIGSYTVNVKNDTVSIGTSNVTISEHKIAKINIISSELEISNTIIGTTTTQIGHATYQILDQYGIDITNSSLAQSITWTCGIGNAVGSNGLLIITPFSGATNLLTSYTNTTINAIDGITKVTATSNVSVMSPRKIGETVTVHDSVWGTYELTISNVELTSERNQSSKTIPAEVYKVTYTYKLLSKVSATSMGLYINGFDSSIDSTNELGETYPNNINKIPKELYLVGNSCTAETFIGVDNPTTKLILIKKYSTNTGSNFVTFTISTNK
ncbi:hypothetical protein K9O30_01890 [Clostridium bowmanii]|uniref:hypothetical protein n=1 Tax=Clostridium bowmanii TaxID=132925 RepID=UPI001C0CED01|nr:hypothetical protein [Clostridium bowmanii]MBU3190279.1 hypothetical protein [Clostridium bowmanii]MCA1072509.1 hypothetical protein [Clostridium bowmanii]